MDDESTLNLNEGASMLLGFLARRKWWVILPACSVALAAIAVLKFLPNRYKSSATLMIVQQQVPERYVAATSPTDKASALEAMKQEVLSRTRLLKMINEFGLYPKERKRFAPEDLIGLMIADVDVDPSNDKQRGAGAFTISFTAENAILAQQVTNNLTSLFINEYLRTGAEQATKTSDFLHEQAQAKAKELQVQEELLRDFKLRHMGELPEQQPGNLGILTGLQSQLTNTSASLNRLQQQRMLLQAQHDTAVRRKPPAGVAPTNPVLVRYLAKLEAAQNEVTRLETAKASYVARGFTAQHPDILKADREIAQARRVLSSVRAEAPPPDSKNASTPLEAQRDPDDTVIAQLVASLEANRFEIENLTKDEARLKAGISQYENRLNQTPVREQQLAGIIRDTEQLRQQHAELQKMEQQSQLATNLERKQGGQQFRLIDPANLPVTPFSPKRFKISMMGVAAGIALGFALAILMELRDTSYRREKDMIAQLAPPFVLGVPLLSTPAEERRQRWIGKIHWVGASALVLAVLMAEVYIYKRG